jgi:Membrane bound beta barrel domain (DUF5777)
MKTLLFLAIFLSPFFIFAQDDISTMLDSMSTPKTDYAAATFKSTRIVTAHSVERMIEGQLEFRISHRFGVLNSGSGNLWGLDQATTFYSLEYGITDWLEVGVGRTPIEKTYLGFGKISLWRQCKGVKNMPVSISILSEVGINSAPFDDPSQTNYFSSRLSYVNQVLIARKFSEIFSLQVSPTIIHRNLAPNVLDPNDIYAMGFGGRIKLSNRISFNAEYFYVQRPFKVTSDYNNALSIGFDIETGGHVFQLMLTNAQGIYEKHYIGENVGTWQKGFIHLGFNVSRVFTIY